MSRRVGIHVQAWTAGTLDSVLRSRPPVLKVMATDVDPVRQVLAARPDTIIVCRQFYDQSQQDAYLTQGDYYENGRTVARNVIGQFRNIIALAPQRLYLESFNETGLWSLADAYDRFSVGFANECKDQGLRPAVYSFATGNPPGYEQPDGSIDLASYWAHYHAGLRAAIAAGGALALHEYSAPAMQDQQTWLCLRYRRVVDVLPPDLKAIPILVTETGIDGGVIGAPSPAAAGWRNYASTEEYVSQLRWYDDEISQDAQVIGATIFTAGNADMWGSFDVTGVTEIEQFIAEQEESVPLTETKMTYIGPATLKASTVNQVEIEASGVEAGIFTLIVNPDNVDDAASVDGATSFFGVLGNHAPESTQQRIVNGRNILQVPVNRLLVPGPVGADFKISIAETDGTSFEGGDRIVQRVTIAASVAPQPQPPDPPVATADYDAAWAGLTAAQQAAAKDQKLIRAGEYGKDVIRWRKGEIPEPPDVVLATDPPKARR